MSIATGTGVRHVLEKAYAGERLTFEDGLALMRSPDLLEIAAAADHVRRRFHPDDTVTFIIDRNINYTNVCAAQCSFCAFKRDPGHPEGYVLSWEELDRKCQELVDQGGTQVLLQGGLNPDLKLDYYQELIHRIQSKFPQLTVHGFSPAEIWFLARISRMSLRECIRALRDAGLRSIPGGGGEILVDRVRRRIGKGKVLTDQWFEVMEVAQELGLNTTATMMYGHVETVEEQVETLIRIRSSQDRYGGYMAFIHWDFQPGGTRLGAEMEAEGGYHLGTGWDYLRIMAVARLILDNMPNIQVSWVTQGPKLAQVALRFGANDFGGTMMEENVVSAAGTAHHVNPDDAVRLIRDAGFHPAQRDTFYNVIRRF